MCYNFFAEEKPVRNTNPVPVNVVYEDLPEEGNPEVESELDPTSLTALASNALKEYQSVPAPRGCHGF